VSVEAGSGGLRTWLAAAIRHQALATHGMESLAFACGMPSALRSTCLKAQTHGEASVGVLLETTTPHGPTAAKPKPRPKIIVR